MSLYDRLETVRRTQSPVGHPGQVDAPLRPHAPAKASVDPFATVKAAVHQTLLESLGPQLYDPNLEQADLEVLTANIHFNILIFNIKRFYIYFSIFEG